MKSNYISFLSICMLPFNAYAMKPISHIIAEDPEYIGGEFAATKSSKSIYTTPTKPSKSPTQSVQIYEGTPKELPYEKVLMRVNIGKDGRSRISNTIKWPYSFHAQLSLYFADGEYGGSAVMVGPHHMLTAGHNVYNHKTNEWVKNIIARLGLNGQAAPFGSHPAVKIYTFEEWTKDHDPNFDIALITLNYPIGLETGWTGVLADDDKELEKEEVHVTGYPGDKGFNQLWTMSHQVKKLDPERIFYETDTYGGQSGGSIWIKKDENPYAIGVHTLGEGKSYEGNSGVRLSYKKVEMLQNWISLTLEIKQAILLQPSKKSSSMSLPVNNQHSTTQNPSHLKKAVEETTLAGEDTIKKCILL